MKLFRRGIRRQGAINKAIAFFETPVGRRIVEDKTLQICIRDNYLNVYKNGCSILKFKPMAIKHIYSIHKAYFEIPYVKGAEYISLEETNDDLVTKCGKSFTDQILNMQSESLKNYLNVTGEKDDEKKCISDYLQQETPLLLDLEVGYSRKRDEDEMVGKVREFVADRIDMAVLDLNGGTPKLRMIEVKLESDTRIKSDDGTIRPNEDRKPEILDQLKKYSDFLSSQNKNIIESYLIVAKNYIDMGIAGRLWNVDKVSAERILNEFIYNLQNNPSNAIDLSPHLLIIDTEPGKKTDLKNKHFNRLKELIGDKYPQPVRHVLNSL
jgi:hypothetical protein